MKILVVGAGAIGGYFGGRMLQAGRDVTFLVRPERRRRLAETGLVIRDRVGEVVLPEPPTLVANELDRPFDLVLLSCKAYDLEGAIAGFAPAVGPDTAILPLLNGMAHLDRLDQLGTGSVLGGLCQISSALDPDGRILHLNDMQSIVYGQRDHARPARIEAIASALSGCGFDAQLSDGIMQDMWEKWVFIASAAGINCLMRGAVGDLVAAGADGFALALLDECAAIAAGQGFPPRAAALERCRGLFTAAGSPLTASMLRDLERGAPIEAAHVIGDLLRRGSGQPLLSVVNAHLRVYEARRARS